MEKRGEGIEWFHVDTQKLRYTFQRKFEEPSRVPPEGEDSNHCFSPRFPSSGVRQNSANFANSPIFISYSVFGSGFPILRERETGYIRDHLRTLTLPVMNLYSPLRPIGILAMAASMMLSACEAPASTDMAEAVLIPLPVSLQPTASSLTLNKDFTIFLSEESETLRGVGDYLSEFLAPATGYSLEVTADPARRGKSVIDLQLTEDSELGTEGYELTITGESVVILGNTPESIFRGVQTLRQLLPAKIEQRSQQRGPWVLPGGTIRDYPLYSYRGVMLDVARHFFGVEDVKRFIDFVAAYKMNVLHLHLSDDQGWRIEIESWPNLTLNGGSTEVGGGKGGFYTKAQYREIVQYAADRFITIIPEIDVPGHTNAALASYPELNCDGVAPALYTGTEVGFSSLCTSKELTYQFLDDVIGELADMTPGPYIHIGGDESHATDAADYLPFVNRVQKIVQSHGKSMIGWDETAQADLSEGSVVQLWNNAEFAKLAVQKGAKLIMSPATKVYLDMQYDSTSRIGLHWAAYIEVKDAYRWDPATIIPGIDKDYILGIEAALWTETVTNMEDIEYLVFPRLPGCAEVAWSPSEARDWEEYKERLARHGERMRMMGIRYYESPLIPWSGTNSSTPSLSTR